MGEIKPKKTVQFICLFNILLHRHTYLKKLKKLRVQVGIGVGGADLRSTLNRTLLRGFTNK
jgi:hypothetical protein